MNLQSINFTNNKKTNIDFNGAIKLPRKVGKEAIVDFSKQFHDLSDLLISDHNISFRFHDLGKENEALEYLKMKNVNYIHYNDPLLSVDDFRNFAKD